MSKPPSGVARPWEDLLSQRALLHETWKQFKGIDHFGKMLSSDLLQERKDAAALEAFADRAFEVILVLCVELLIAEAPDDRSEIKRLPAEAVLNHLRNAKVLSAPIWEVLDEVREGRNDLTHERSFVPWRQVWRHIEQIENTIDKILLALQEQFHLLGMDLEMEFPDFQPGS